jgi:hypothetical protein
MKSNNPVFARSEEFNRASSNSSGNQTYAAGGSSYPAGLRSGAIRTCAETFKTESRMRGPRTAQQERERNQPPQVARVPALVTGTEAGRPRTFGSEASRSRRLALPFGVESAEGSARCDAAPAAPRGWRTLPTPALLSARKCLESEPRTGLVSVRITGPVALKGRLRSARPPASVGG